VSPGPRDARGVLSQRILTEARTAFAKLGWAGTTARSVARAAGVDPALVYHYFGSKKGLLDAATALPDRLIERVAAAWEGPDAELGERLVRHMLAVWQDQELGPTLQAILQIAAHEPKTLERLRSIIRAMMGQSKASLRDRERRSGLIAAQLFGLAFMRFVWKIEPLATMTDEAVVAAVGPTIQRYVDGDLGRARR